MIDEDRFLDDIEKDIEFKLDNIDEVLRGIDLEKQAKENVENMARQKIEEDMIRKKFRYLFRYDELREDEQTLLQELAKCMFLRHTVIHDCRSCRKRVKIFIVPMYVEPLYENPFERSVEAKVHRAYCPNCGGAFMVRAEKIILSIIEEPSF